MPRTATELREAIEAGHLAGEIVYEGKAKEELENRRKITIRAGEITAGRLEQAAKDLETEALDATTKHDIKTRHQLMHDAYCFHIAAQWLHVTDHPGAQPEGRNGASGS